MTLFEDNAIHLGQTLDSTTLDSLADFICGDDVDKFPIYRSSSHLTRFFQNININETHDGSTRKWWVLNILKGLTPSDLEKTILRLVNLREYKTNKEFLKKALEAMNDILAIEELKIGFRGTNPILLRSDPIDFEKEFNKTIDSSESTFLNKQFSEDIKINDLKLDSVITEYLQERIEEIQSSPKHKTPLSTIFLLGSTLEGILLAIAIKNKDKFTKAKSAPKNKSSHMLNIYDWKLYSLIDVAHEVGFIDQDVKKFSHVLRDFRNYIHPYRQMSENFHPNQHTVDICWQVFKAAYEQIKTKVI